MSRRSAETFFLDVAGRRGRVSIARINSATVECRLKEDLLSFQGYHHPGLVRPLSALPVETSGGAEAKVPQIEPEVPDKRSIRSSRKQKQPKRFSDFVFIFTSGGQILSRSKGITVLKKTTCSSLRFMRLLTCHFHVTLARAAGTAGSRPPPIPTSNGARERSFRMSHFALLSLTRIPTTAAPLTPARQSLFPW